MPSPDEGVAPVSTNFGIDSASAQEFSQALGDSGFRHGEEAALGVSIGRGQWSRLTTIGWSAAALMALVLGWSLLRS